MQTIEALVLGANQITGELPKEVIFMASVRLMDLSNT